MLAAPGREDDQAREGDPLPASRVLWERWLLPACLALVVLPFVVAVLAQRSHQWFPVLDLVMTELRVRDVFTRHTPLVGLPGRIGDFPDQGSHPGPLSFYALTPFYRLFGSTSWALQAAAGTVNVIACGLALWIGRRRGGAAMVAAVALLLTVLLAGYGMDTFIEPWNPLMPILWWVVLLLAVWSVLGRDVVVLPVAVLAASFCAQTHVPYLGLALGLGALAVVGLLLALRNAPPGSDARRSVLRWGAASAALALVLWTPPLVDQATAERSNLSMLAEHFTTDPPEARIGPATGTEWLLVNLNPTRFLAGPEGISGGPLVRAAQDPDASPVPGALLVAVWAAAVAVAWRRRHPALLRLHAVIGAGLVLGAFSLTNVFGKQWYYLTLWTWALAALMLGSILWTALVVVRPALGAEAAARLRDGAGVVMLVLAVAFAGLAAVRSLDDEPPEATLSEVVGEVAGPTAAALDDGVGAATGPDGRYLLTVGDVAFMGSQAYGVALELERRGYDVAMTETFRVPMTAHRVASPEDVDAELRFVTGARIAETAAIPGAVEVAFTDPRSPAEREEWDGLRDEILDDLAALGLDDLVELVDANLFAVSIDPRLPVWLERKAFQLLELGLPTAVFVLPVER